MNNKYSLPKDGGLIAESTPRDIIHRYEKIHTTVYENEYLGVQYVADTIVKAIRTYNELHCSNEVYEEQQPFVLGLTTGRTPLGLYREPGETPQGGPRRLPQRGRIQPRRVLPHPLDRAAEPQLPHPRGFPQPHRHPARKHPHPRRHHLRGQGFGVLRLVRPFGAQDRPDDYRRGRRRPDRFQRAGFLCQVAHPAGAGDPQHPQNPIGRILRTELHPGAWPSRWVSTRSCGPTRSS